MNAAVLKTVDSKGSGGSNPSPSANSDESCNEHRDYQRRHDIAKQRTHPPRQGDATTGGSLFAESRPAPAEAVRYEEREGEAAERQPELAEDEVLDIKGAVDQHARPGKHGDGEADGD